MPLSWVAGVDSCRAGWIVIVAALSGASTPPPFTVHLCPTFAAVLTITPRPTVIAVDIPIGLLDTPHPGGRLCDQQARRLLGRRASSVFSPPCRDILEATHYDQVRGHGMSRQAFGILPKIRQVDHLMTPALQHLVYEAHPELAFLRLAGQPMQQNKKTAAGRQERLQALARAPDVLFDGADRTLASALEAFPRAQVASDDVLDACVLLRTAYAIVCGQAQRVPATPPVDRRGLRMEIWH